MLPLTRVLSVCVHVRPRPAAVPLPPAAADFVPGQSFCPSLCVSCLLASCFNLWNLFQMLVRAASVPPVSSPSSLRPPARPAKNPLMWFQRRQQRPSTGLEVRPGAAPRGALGAAPRGALGAAVGRGGGAQLRGFGLLQLCSATTTFSLLKLLFCVAALVEEPPPEDSEGQAAAPTLLLVLPLWLLMRLTLNIVFLVA